MQVKEEVPKHNDKKTLKDFIPLVIAFFGSLSFLSFYQNVHLYFNGVLDAVMTKSLFWYLLNQTGFVAICALLLAFVFNFLEGKRANLGYRAVKFIFLLLLLAEGLLMSNYIINYDVLGFDWFLDDKPIANLETVLLYGLILFPFSGWLFIFLAKITRPAYALIGKMYPFTIVVFSLFLATLNTEKKPISENKMQHLLTGFASGMSLQQAYRGTAEYPLLRPFEEMDVLGTHFDRHPQTPNIVILILEGVGSDFVGTKAQYSGFMPFLESLKDNSLFWENFVSNTGESFAAMPTIIGSLPFGKNGFTNLETPINRNTLFGILKHSGYTTSFNFGGNTALHQYDRFLDEERVDNIMDWKSFDPEDQLQERDAAGISLGYPDKAVFEKWASYGIDSKKPKLEVFLTLSAAYPFSIPNAKEYRDKVDMILKTSHKTSQIAKRIKSNKKMFASMLYTDDALAAFFKRYSERTDFENTIFIVTGSQNQTSLSAENELSRYRVPLLIYSPLLKAPKTISGIASHADIAPSLIAYLYQNHALKVPSKTAWIGGSLIPDRDLGRRKAIPLFRNRNTIQDLIYGPYFSTSGHLYMLGRDMELVSQSNAPKKEIKEALAQFKAVNEYVTAQNKILPEQLSTYPVKKPGFTKQEMVWINSVLNGRDLDRAYDTARELGFNKEWERAILLCQYILSQVPRHADAEILLGRIYAWKADYERAMVILEEAVRKYPVYTDGYLALLDVYFWAGKNEKALHLLYPIERNNIQSPDIIKKMDRAKHNLQDMAVLESIQGTVYGRNGKLSTGF